MEPIPRQFDDHTFRYSQEWREGMWAIYRQEHKQGRAVRFEVVRLHIQPERTWPNGQTTPEKESYPPSSAWGREGWTCFTRHEADALLATVRQETTTPQIHEETL